MAVNLGWAASRVGRQENHKAGTKLNHRLRWLLPPDTDCWVGYHDGREVAQVWPHGLVGNSVAEWRWELLFRELAGSVPGTTDEDHDRYRAQRQASDAYFS